ncbi:MAG: Sec-independent protein translocase subunit TatA/TatB [Candidatus Acidiferrales bacterium]
MGPLGFPEILLILVVALLLFGPRRLPELGRTLGRSLAEFRRASSDLRATIESEIHSLERETTTLADTPRPPSLNPSPGGPASKPEEPS